MGVGNSCQKKRTKETEDLEQNTETENLEQNAETEDPGRPTYLTHSMMKESTFDRWLERETEDLVSDVGVEGLLSMCVPVMRAVVKLVGKDGSGKTSLLRSLQRLKFNAAQASSQAVQIETLRQMKDREPWHLVHETDVLDFLASLMKKTASDQRQLKFEEYFATIVREGTEEKQQFSIPEHSQDEVHQKALAKQLEDFLDVIPTEQPKIILQVCDHGGQEDFFATSATFASSGCVCIVTLNGTEDLEAEAQSFIRQTNVDGFKQDHVKLHRVKHNKDWINHHLSVISVSQQPEDGRYSSEASSAAGIEAGGIGHAFGTYSPPVIFAATHADQIPKGKEQEVIRSREKELKRVLGNKRFSNHVYRRPPGERSPLFFCIDNTKSHPPYSRISGSIVKSIEEEDGEMVKLRQLIMSAVEKHGKVHMTRAAWLLLEDEVYKMRFDPKKKIIPLQEFATLARKKCALKSESDVVSALNHLHELHVVVYFANCLELMYYVFVDAPWVFTTLSHLNSLKLAVPITEGQFHKDVPKLQEDGIMSEALCRHLLDSSDDGKLTEETHTVMVKAAELLDILTPNKRKAKDEGACRDGYVTEYFVPGALQEDDDEVPPMIPHSQIGVPSPVHLVLRPENVGMFIEALFFRLINRCVRRYSAHSPYLRRNHVIFYMPDGCDIELFYVHDYVVVVMRPNPELCYEVVRKSCVETREFLVSQLEDVKKQGLAGFQFSVCFQHLTARDKPFVPIQDNCLVRLDQYPQSKRLFYINKKSIVITREEEKGVAIWFPKIGEAPMASAALHSQDPVTTRGPSSPMASQSHDVTHMVNVKVEAKQRMAVGERVAGRWEELALHLSPNFFTQDKVLVIKQENPYNRILQANAMLDKWSDQFDIQATCGAIVKGLLDMGCKAKAAEVFPRQLVELVEQQQQHQKPKQHRETDV